MPSSLREAYEAGVKLALAEAGLGSALKSVKPLKFNAMKPPSPGLNPTMSNFGNTPLRLPTDAGPIMGSSPLPFSVLSDTAGGAKSGMGSATSGVSSGVTQSN